MIGKFDEIQDRIFDELTEIFDGDMERPATFRDLNEMKYLERVLKESLRIFPSVPNISRKMNEDISIGKLKISYLTAEYSWEFTASKKFHLENRSRRSHDSLFSPYQGEYIIPKGAFVALQIYFIHRDER